MRLLRKIFESWFCGKEASVPSLSKGDLFPFLKIFFTEMWAIAAVSASVEEFDHHSFQGHQHQSYLLILCVMVMFFNPTRVLA